MLALTLVLPVLLASAGDCYLVTNESIRTIPCEFSAATTDALRYELEDTEVRSRPQVDSPPRVEPAQKRVWRRGQFRRPSRDSADE